MEKDCLKIKNLKNFVKCVLLILLFSISIIPVNVFTCFKRVYQATGIFSYYKKSMLVYSLLNMLFTIYLVVIVRNGNYILYCMVGETRTHIYSLGDYRSIQLNYRTKTIVYYGFSQKVVFFHNDTNNKINLNDSFENPIESKINGEILNFLNNAFIWRKIKTKIDQ